MPITISAPELEEKLSKGASIANLTVEEYAERVLWSAVDAPSSSDEMPRPSAYYTLKVDKSPEAIQAALDVLKSFDEDDLEERRQSAEYLRRALDEDRLSRRSLFIDERDQPS